ncbi:putative membrane protein [Methanonatronarchaeum thermophilum]|uniref:Putative membrane protein n=1 Tax=Methanonatronarchaeum thermophilum TaxID=1927129 RepID=A0A1Y3GG86_9EURY|nr:DUF5668 domain-containing protein [Methanonatronarchaeum thermophilum]OUJ18386.1 putative membrane protein [Methanonatronarchaeum thermophilum]
MKKITFQAVLAVILIAIGVILLLETTGIYDTTHLIKYTPTLFVLFGIYAIIKSKLTNILGPLIIILFFGILQLLILNLITTTVIREWWPLIIVAIGLLILINWLQVSKIKGKETDTIDLFTMLGGHETLNTSNNFKGGNITAILGSVNIDLRDAEIKNPPATINCIVILGGAEIKIPEGWEVKNNITPILGAVEDTRLRTEKQTENKKQEITINGIVLLGGLDIKD